MVLEKVNQNFRFLRKQEGKTQQEFADMLNIKRASVGAYEEGRAKPNLDVIKQLSEKYHVSIDWLITRDLSKIKAHEWRLGKESDISGKSLRVLSITLNDEERENIELVPVKASAGYLSGYADPEFLSELPRFSLPMLPNGTYRAFEIKGDSMLPLMPGSVVIGEYVEDWNHIKDGHTYIVLSRDEGVVYKRLFNSIEEEGVVTCQSDNPSYPPFSLRVEDVLEVWKAKLFISKAEPQGSSTPDSATMMAMIQNLQTELHSIKKR